MQFMGVELENCNYASELESFLKEKLKGFDCNNHWSCYGYCLDKYFQAYKNFEELSQNKIDGLVVNDNELANFIKELACFGVLARIFKKSIAKQDTPIFKPSDFVSLPVEQ